MARVGIVAAFVFLAGLAGYLLATRDPAPPPRAAPTVRDDAFLRTRVAELERRIEVLEERDVTAWPAAEEGAAAPGERIASSATAPAATGTAASASIRAEWQRQQDNWVRRFQEARTPTARVAVLRDAGVQLRKHTSRATTRAFYEEVLRTVDPVSEEGIYARFELGHLARGEGDYARSDELYRGIEASVPAGSEHAAYARFQLAWNRKYSGEPLVAKRFFRDVVDAPAVKPTTKVAAIYALAKLHGETGDAAGVKLELERLLEEARRHPGNEGVAYYADLAKKLLESLG